MIQLDFLPYDMFWWQPASALHCNMHDRVTWIQIQETKFVEGYVVLDSTEILPIFGMIINILLINSDKPYFVCEVLETEEFSSNFHSFVVWRDKLIPIVFCKPSSLSD